MKLLNYTSTYFSIILMIIIPIWAGIFYFAMLDEVYDSMDDGLDNQRQLIISKASHDTAIVNRTDFEEGNYSIKPIAKTGVQTFTDKFTDTLMYMANEKDFEPVRMLETVFRKGQNYYQLRVITSMVEEDDLIKELTQALVWLYFGLILTIIFLNNFLLRNIWKPFHQLISQLKDFKLNKVQAISTRPTNIDEFNQLQESVQNFLANNVSAYNSQKQFIENASHELQTPLAIAINKLELLAESDELSEDKIDLLAGALSNLERLKRLNRSLLLLSKIENEQFHEQVKVNINDLAKGITDDFSDMLQYQKIILQVIERAPCIWQINPDLADILLTNLIKNAVKHSSAGDKVTISFDTDTFEIRNAGMEPLDADLIYQRFYKAGTAHESTGLGLAIAKAVVSVSGLELNYHFDAAHIFRIKPKD